MLDSNYWSNRYQTGDTGWNVGKPTTPIKEFVDSLTDKNLKILVPGAGMGYEAAYLWEQGFRKVFVCDWAAEAFEHLKKICPQFAVNQLITGDFFLINDTFDLIVEQTFFCAIDRNLRPKYAQKTSELLHTEGVLAGLLFNKEFPLAQPPFGGSIEEYWQYFEPFFDVVKMEECYNSIPSRAGTELWVHLVKR